MRRGIGFLCMLLSLALIGPAMGKESMSALEAFEALKRGETKEGESTKDSLLAEVMEGKYALAASGQDEMEEYASVLASLCEITNADLASYASGKGLYMAQVRNAYFRALANAVRAEITLHPASEEKLRNSEAILKLFLNLPGEDSSSEDSSLEAASGKSVSGKSVSTENVSAKEEIRSQMSEAQSQVIAASYDLPSSFVDFLIMDENWEDDSWENDANWLSEQASSLEGGESFQGAQIGDRDTAGSVEIAKMQEILISLGFLSGKADGIYGARTQEALLEFELSNGLPATGSYTASDFAALQRTDLVARWDYQDAFYLEANASAYGTHHSGDTNDSHGYDTYVVNGYDYDTYDSYAYDTYDYDTHDYDTYDYDAHVSDSYAYDTYDYDTFDYDTYDYDTHDSYDTYDTDDDHDT